MNVEQSATSKGKKCVIHSRFGCWCVYNFLCLCVCLSRAHSLIVGKRLWMLDSAVSLYEVFVFYLAFKDRQTSIYTHAHHSKCIMFWIQCTISRFVCTVYLTSKSIFAGISFCIFYATSTISSAVQMIAMMIT